MPRKVEVTPTVTEGRSKRTPKPNLKYAMDFVQTVRAVTPERTEEDDEYKPAPKKRLLDDSTSPSSAAAAKVVKGKIMQPQIRLSKVGVNESPKTPVRKTPGKVEKKPTPMPSKLASIKAGLMKQGLPLVKALGRSKSEVAKLRTTAKTSTSETESDIGEAPSPKEVRVTRSGPTRGTPPSAKAAAPSPPIKLAPGKTGALAQKIVPPTQKTAPPQKAPPQKVIPQKVVSPPAKPAPPRAVIRTAAAPLKVAGTRVAPKVVPAKVVAKPVAQQAKPAAKPVVKRPDPVSDVEIDEMYEDPFGDDSFGEPTGDGDDDGFQFVDIAKIIGGAPKRKAEPESKAAGAAAKRFKDAEDSMIDFEEEISAASVQRASRTATIRAPGKQTPPAARKDAPKIIMRSREQKKDEASSSLTIRKEAAAKQSPQMTKIVAGTKQPAKPSPPTKTAPKLAKASPPGVKTTTAKRSSLTNKEETIEEISKMVAEKKPTRLAGKKSLEDSFDDFDDDDDDEDDFGEEETETDEGMDEDDDIEAILSGVKSPAAAPKGKVDGKKTPAAGAKKDEPKEKSKDTAKKPSETVKTAPKKELPGKPVTKAEVNRKVKSPELIKKIMKPLAESQNVKQPAAASSSSAAAPKEVEKMSALDKFFVLNFPNISSQPPRAVLCLSLIKLGNRIKEIQLPSLNWSYRITLQKLNNKENTSDKGEVYTGDIQDSGIDESERGSYAPVNISFQRVLSAETPNSDTIKTVTFQNKSFQILLKGKACRLIGSPQYIYDVTEIQTLLEIVEKVDPQHSYVENA